MGAWSGSKKYQTSHHNVHVKSAIHSPVIRRLRARSLIHTSKHTHTHTHPNQHPQSNSKHTPILACTHTHTRTTRALVSALSFSWRCLHQNSTCLVLSVFHVYNTIYLRWRCWRRRKLIVPSLKLMGLLRIHAAKLAMSSFASSSCMVEKSRANCASVKTACTLSWQGRCMTTRLFSRALPPCDTHPKTCNGVLLPSSVCVCLCVYVWLVSVRVCSVAYEWVYIWIASVSIRHSMCVKEEQHLGEEGTLSLGTRWCLLSRDGGMSRPHNGHTFNSASCALILTIHLLPTHEHTHTHTHTHTHRRGGRICRDGNDRVTSCMCVSHVTYYNACVWAMSRITCHPCWEGNVWARWFWSPVLAMYHP